MLNVFLCVYRVCRENRGKGNEQSVQIGRGGVGLGMRGWDRDGDGGKGKRGDLRSRMPKGKSKRGNR